MTATERAAYLAGAIDGEGWIGLQRIAPNAERGIKSPRFKFGLTIANTNRPWLETIQSWVGGTIYEMRGKANKRRCHFIRFSATEVKAILGMVMPYLLIKRRQAELLIQFFPLAAVRRMGNGYPASGADPGIVSQQEAIYRELRRLNQRGENAHNYTPQTERRECEFAGCKRVHYGRGYCWIHYRKFIVRGGPALHELACKECGKPFSARRSDAEFCSRECAAHAYYVANSERIKAQVAARKKRLAVT
jgi:hypothetical protein